MSFTTSALASAASGASSALDASVGNCSFTDIETFFEYAQGNALNITQEVQRCQNLCLLTYGNGNPDLSGIGMMYAYTFQAALTVCFGPILRLLHVLVPRLPWKSKFGLRHMIKGSAEIQIVFWEADGFMIFASAVATLVRMVQKPTIFEIAEMQILMFVQVNSLLIIFFCLVHPVERWWSRFFQFLLNFGLGIAALSQSRLTGAAELQYYQASLACINKPAFKTITPIPYHKAVVFVAAGLCAVSFVAQSALTVVRVENRMMKKVVAGLAVLWGLLTTLSLAGMLWGVVVLWKQRDELHALVGEDFEDNQWGFGQIAALFTWIPILVEFSYKFNDWLKDRSTRWARLQALIAPSETDRHRAVKVVETGITPVSRSTTEDEEKGGAEPHVTNSLLPPRTS